MPAYRKEGFCGNCAPNSQHLLHLIRNLHTYAEQLRFQIKSIENKGNEGAEMVKPRQLAKVRQ